MSHGQLTILGKLPRSDGCENKQTKELITASLLFFLYSYGYLDLSSFIHVTFLEHLLCVRHCLSHLEVSYFPFFLKEEKICCVVKKISLSCLKYKLDIEILLE